MKTSQHRENVWSRNKDHCDSWKKKISNILKQNYAKAAFRVHELVITVNYQSSMNRTTFSLKQREKLTSSKSITQLNNVPHMRPIHASCDPTENSGLLKHKAKNTWRSPCMHRFLISATRFHNSIFFLNYYCLCRYLSGLQQILNIHSMFKDPAQGIRADQYILLLHI